MADQTPSTPQGPSKKDTVRINLPSAITPPPSAADAESAKVTIPINLPQPPARAGGGPAAGPSAGPVDESKKETAVMGKPVGAEKAKSDTSRVQVASARPAVPEMPRPTVKLRRESETQAITPPSPSAVAAPAARPAAAPVEAGASGAEIGLAVIAMLLSIGVVVYLIMVKGV
jgi:hypothetical protein